MFATHALVRFKDTESAAKVLHFIHDKTNLSANFSTRGSKKNKFDQEEISPFKKTIHITNIDRDPLSLYQLFLGYQGFSRIAFFGEYCFVCFVDLESSANAIEEMLFTTKLKASYAKAEFSPHFLSPTVIGTPSNTLKLVDIPLGLQPNDISLVSQMYTGFTAINSTSPYLIQFDSIQHASQALMRINQETNLSTVFVKTKPLWVPMEEPTKVQVNPSEIAPAAETNQPRTPSEKGISSPIMGFPVPKVFPIEPFFGKSLKTKTIRPLKQKIEHIQHLLSELDVLTDIPMLDKCTQTTGDAFEALKLENQALQAKINRLEAEMYARDNDQQRFQVLQGLLNMCDVTE